MAFFYCRNSDQAPTEWKLNVIGSELDIQLEYLAILVRPEH